MKTKFVLSYIFGLLWLAVSFWFAIFWAGELTTVWPAWYVWGVVGGIALLPGFLMSSMFFSNLLHRKVREYPDTAESVTVIMCAHNEEEQIAGTIRAVLNQRYRGCIRLLVVDNASTDGTRGEILLQKAYADGCRRRLEYLYCGKKGKAHALNCALKRVCTKHFITVDADTYLEKQAVQKIMNHICACQSGCVAGNLFVKNPRASLAAAMQNYDYLLSIAAVKRFQGSYRSTLVAQGAFSAYDTAAVRQVGGWKDVLGEDIVLTYQLLEKGFGSEYQAAAVGYTTVPETISGLYNQRKRWAAGMLEGLSTVRPWQQGSIYSRHFFLGEPVGDLAGPGLFVRLCSGAAVGGAGVFLSGGLPYPDNPGGLPGVFSQYLSLPEAAAHSLLQQRVGLCVVSGSVSDDTEHGGDSRVSASPAAQKGGVEMKRQNILFVSLTALVILAITAALLVAIRWGAGL